MYDVLLRLGFVFEGVASSLRKIATLRARGCGSFIGVQDTRKRTVIALNIPSRLANRN
jgi:hypothetical protein